MGDFEEKLGSILQNPETMGQIMALAQSLEGGAQGEQNPEPVAAQGFDGIDPRFLELGMRAVRAWQDPEDPRAHLLQALHPFTKEEKLEKIKKAEEILKISRAIRIVLEGLKGGQTDV